MEPLLLFGYTLIFVVLFGYLWRLHRRLDRLDRRVRDAEN